MTGNPKITRRVFINYMGLGLASLYLPRCASLSSVGTPGFDLHAMGPIERDLGNTAARAYSGDNPNATHNVLWAKEEFLKTQGGLPEVSETTPLVIIGGGMSGLFSAYLLRDFNPVVLERAERFGGNSRGESWNGLDYSIGAAYFMEPEKGSELESHLHDLGVTSIARVKSSEDPILLNKKRFYEFWKGDSAPSHRAEFKRLYDYFQKVYNSEGGYSFPEIPAHKEEEQKTISALDKISFRKQLELIAEKKLHPHIECALEHFCWSSLGGSLDEISAAAGLNFFAGEFGKVWVTPGGNAGVAEKLLLALSKSISKRNLRTQSIAFDVRVAGDHIVVSYLDSKNKCRAIKAKAVIFACPKFATAKILNDIEPERVTAIKKLEYRSYLVANVLLNKPIKDDFYDLYLIGDGKGHYKDIRQAATKQKITDVVYGNYAKVDSHRSVLTLYRAFPYPAARPELLANESYERMRSEFETQIDSEILDYVGASKTDVVDVRISRWGHPLPLAKVGLFSDGTMAAIQKPFRDRVFFIEQDNWLLPAFETAAHEAIYWTKKVRQVL